jgi:hypothetical protein
MTEKKKPKLTDTERHKRFVDTAKKVGASDNLTDFDNAFDKILSNQDEKNKSRRWSGGDE